jgi:hypothetical protein
MGVVVDQQLSVIQVGIMQKANSRRGFLDLLSTSWRTKIAHNDTNVLGDNLGYAVIQVGTLSTFNDFVGVVLVLLWLTELEIKTRRSWSVHSFATVRDRG